jgi:penicillin-insensitive murein DD-endopeptidase
MLRGLAVVTALSLMLLIYGAAAKNAAPVRVPLPPSSPLKNTERESKENSKPAMVLFSEKKLPTLGRAIAIGYYPRGCLQGGVDLPTTGPTWQVMRMSRNRNWGHPELVKFLERFAPLAAEATGWKGILIGDMAQPRGGPLPFGHRSHQVGLDVDIWFMPMPDRVLSAKERENISAPDVVAADGKRINNKIWSSAHIAFIRTAAEQSEVERVLVNAAIKKELCRVRSKNDESWMSKVRPWYGHADHIHVRLKCPADSPDCRAQPAVPAGDGCDKSLNHWFADWILRLKIPNISPSASVLKLKDLPPACAAVLNAPPSPDGRGVGGAMRVSALGHKRTFRSAIGMSALPPKADCQNCYAQMWKVGHAQLSAHCVEATVRG